MAFNDQPDDATLAVVDEVAEVLEDTAADTRATARDLRSLASARRAGRPWLDTLTGSGIRGTLGLLTDAMRRASIATGMLRRTISRQLFDNGVRVGQIATLLGVSHQRVSSVLGQRPGRSDGSEPATGEAPAP